MFPNSIRFPRRIIPSYVRQEVQEASDASGRDAPLQGAAILERERAVRRREYAVHEAEQALTIQKEAFYIMRGALDQERIEFDSVKALLMHDVGGHTQPQIVAEMSDLLQLKRMAEGLDSRGSHETLLDWAENGGRRREWLCRKEKGLTEMDLLVEQWATISPHQLQILKQRVLPPIPTDV
ncbi:hypothetical protein K488DRAFT_90036 [Vararia minispora EC-137]|uniref:Uncharacterized protein n=1 Tax=Vararia minispora EC-137 TaxID=1314806 RepID=A0ACB8Q8N2_9AGAM|nr:hypothetical protein K488DRAFT_90036 [Vararia minispora EC-137]